MSLHYELGDVQVLANPSCEVQESPKVTRADLKAKGIRPYDEKVRIIP